ncbi:hypothetical protein [Actinomadura madurae]|uniref:hypothetical protein n=1 Tax=Actinomadura madurae TaxID=1993 RepID=UPI0020D21E91|nr:hypothetical protein [Actinomadura madurae]MCQ0011785.1 hypothetical protein [Actinomadura madurae]MCQ0012908.1 hypothetical protein [Actinomadura madurae]
MPFEHPERLTGRPLRRQQGQEREGSQPSVLIGVALLRGVVHLGPAARRYVLEQLPQPVRVAREELAEIPRREAADVLEVRARKAAPAPGAAHHPGGPDHVHPEQGRDESLRELPHGPRGRVAFQQLQQSGRVSAAQRLESRLAPAPERPLRDPVAGAGEERAGVAVGEGPPGGDRVLQLGEEPRDRPAGARGQQRRGLPVAPAGADAREEPVGERRAAGVAERPVERAAQVGRRVVQRRRGGAVGDGQCADGPQRRAPQRHVGPGEDALDVGEVARRHGHVQGRAALVAAARGQGGEEVAEFGRPGEPPGAKGQLPHAKRAGQGFEGRFQDRLGRAQRPGGDRPSWRSCGRS